MTTRAEDYCRLLQEIGFPAARIKESGVLIESNEAFGNLLAEGRTQNDASLFIESVLSGIISTERDRWDAAFANGEPAQFRVQLQSPAGQPLDFVMGASAVVDSNQSGKSIICVFFQLAGPVFERIRYELLSEGEESERSRIRNELHKAISQQLLGAAFGCKALAIRIGRLDHELAREAAVLAELVNTTVAQLQAIVHSDRYPR
jgi:signal transduction histidine kinase